MSNDFLNHWSNALCTHTHTRTKCVSLVKPKIKLCVSETSSCSPRTESRSLKMSYSWKHDYFRQLMRQWIINHAVKRSGQVRTESENRRKGQREREGKRDTCREEEEEELVGQNCHFKGCSLPVGLQKGYMVILAFNQAAAGRGEKKQQHQPKPLGTRFLGQWERVRALYNHPIITASFWSSEESLWLNHWTAFSWRRAYTHSNSLKAIKSSPPNANKS